MNKKSFLISLVISILFILAVLVVGNIAISNRFSTIDNEFVILHKDIKAVEYWTAYRDKSYVKQHEIDIDRLELDIQYEVAIRNLDFQNLQKEFSKLEKEKGEKGEPGEMGFQGLRGLQGEKGDTWYNDLPKLYKQTSPAVVWIGAECSGDDFLKAGWKDSDRRSENMPITVKWQGTGFFVTPNLIATAGHVVDNTKSFIVQFQDGLRAYADFIHMEKIGRCDVGFIKLRGDRCNDSYLKFNTEAKIGESLIILGYPWGLNNGIALTQGVVCLPNRVEPFFGVKLVIQTDVASYPGNSGSPVIDMNGKCVGILIGGMRGCDNFSIVTPAKIAKLAMQKALAEIGLRGAK